MSASGEGWFADPQDASRLRWWDGARWTHHTHPLPGAEHWTRPLPRWWSGLSVVVQASLLTCAAASAFTFWVDLQVLAFVDDVRLRPDTVTLADAERIDVLTLWSLLELVTLLVTGVLFVVWLYTAHHSSRMDRRVLRHGSGWAIGGWFVPVLSLWRPFQVVSDVRRGATGDGGAPVPLRQGWWWGTWVALTVVSGVVSVLYSRATSAPNGLPYADALGAAASWERLSSVLTVVCALLAISLVRELTALVARPTEEHRRV
ncbi:hypothetical protein GCM10023339_22600 [Alloalcanivorax gelatiniphagus]